MDDDKFSNLINEITDSLNQIDHRITDAEEKLNNIEQDSIVDRMILLLKLLCRNGLL